MAKKINKETLKKEAPLVPEEKKVNKEIVNTTAVDFFETLGNKCQWIALALLVLIGGIVFKDFLFGDKIFLHKDIGSDSLNGYFPVIAHNIRYLQQYGFPSWSFEFGMGQNSFAYAMVDPIDYLLYGLGLDKMRSLLGWKIMLELVLAGFAFYHYLRIVKMGQLASIIGCLMYAFSGFMIISSCWFAFTIEVVTMPFILIGIEKLYRNNQFWILPFPILWLVLAKPFVLATLTVFLFVYITFRLFQEDDFSLKSYSFLLGKTALAGLAGVAIAAPWLLEHLQLMLDSPRGSGANSLSTLLKSRPIFDTADKVELGTAISRMFASDILGSGNEFKGWQNIMEAPAFYCGIPSLLLIPQLFSGISKRLKIVFACFLAFWIIPVLFPYFRYAFSFFTGDYYRSFSFYVGLVLTLLAVLSLDKMISTKKVNLLILGATAFVLFCLLYYPYFESTEVRVSSISSFVALFILVYAGILFYIPKNFQVASYALLALFSFELMYLSSISINSRDNVTKDDLTKKIGYNDYTNEAITFLKKQDNDFYRIDKRYGSTPAMHGSLNDGMSQGYFGTSMYNSFNQKYYIQYLKTMAIITGNKEEETRWSAGLVSRMIPEGLNAVKYVLTKSPLDAGTLSAFDSLAKFGDVTVLKNRFVLPFGYAHQQVFSLSDFEKCSAPQRDFMSLRAAIVADSNMKQVASLSRIGLADTMPPQNFTYDIIRNRMDSLSLQSFKLNKFKPSAFSGSIKMNTPGVVYFSIPFDDNWTIKDDKNKVYEKFLLTNGMTGIFAEAGTHNLNFSFASKNLALGKKGSMAGFALLGLLIFLSIKFRGREEKISVE